MTKRKAIPKQTRDQILVDCKHRCVICHEKTPHVHHIVPVEEGSKNDYENLVVLCPTCHDNIHMRHISPSQLHLYKFQWITLCKQGLVAASLDETGERSHRAMYLLERGSGWHGEAAPGFVDPSAPLVSTIVELIERACSALTIKEAEKSRIGPEMFTFYQLLDRMKAEYRIVEEIARKTGMIK